MFYWTLTLKDGNEIQIPPTMVDKVKAKLVGGEPIVTKAATIMPLEVKSFRQSSQRYDQQLLIEAASAAFKEPMIEGRTIKARWVKKPVTKAEWSRHLQAIPGYRLLDNGEDGMLWVAFVMPVHLIDPSKVEYCSENDINLLTKH